MASDLAFSAPKNQSRRRLLLDRQRLVVCITFLAVFAMAARISMDTDTWWHLRAGQWILEHRAVPQTDPFSYTRFGAPWQYPGWLVEAPMFLIYRLFGPGGLNLWTAAMVTAALGFVWKTLSGGPFLRAFLIVFAAAVSAVYWAARPYLVTFLLAAVYLWLLEDFRWERSPRAGKRLVWLPVLMVLWANSHGGFAAGFLIWGVYFAAELVSWLRLRFTPQARAAGQAGSHRTRLARLAGVGGLLVLAVCLNPSGPVMLAYPFKTAGIGALQDYIQEWQSPDFHSLQVQPFAALLLLTLGAVGASRRRLALTDFLLFAGFAYMGLVAGRNIALFALAAPMVLARHLDPLLAALARTLGVRFSPARAASRPQVVLNSLILAVLALAVLAKVSLIYPVQANQEVFADSLPVGAAAYLKETRPEGRLFSTYNWGGYLVWALPEYPVFVDGRTDLYDDEIINEWLLAVRAGDGWEDVLERWDVDLVLLEPEMALADELRQNGWKVIYSDENAAIYQLMDKNTN